MIPQKVLQVPLCRGGQSAFEADEEGFFVGFGEFAEAFEGGVVDVFVPGEADEGAAAGIADRAREIETRLRMVGDLHRGGAGLLAGTDGAVAFPLVVSGYSVHEELALLVEAGLSPLEALRTATLNPARALGRTDDFGAVAPGKLADLVLLDADPLEDITHTTRIRAVVQNGRLLDRAALDALVDRAAAAAAVVE